MAKDCKAASRHVAIGNLSTCPLSRAGNRVKPDNDICV